MKRRDFITTSAATGAALTAGSRAWTRTTTPNQPRYQNGQSPWPICLDFATIRPVKTLKEKVDIAAEAGYDAVEPWDSDLVEYEKSGGDLREMNQYIRDKGMFVPSMIGLWGCLPATEAEFQESLEATRNRMRMAAEIGCEHVQTIPNKVGENYDRR